MNELITQNFENTGVEIILNESGEPLFELYSTGMALGYVKTAKGKTYPQKERIDKVMENAEIITVVHGVQQYLTEEMLYDFMLESKTKKVKPFRKWVTSEVLPTIRKHGSYSITTQQPNEMVADLVQSTMTAILPVITEQMAKVTIQNQQQINQMAGLIHDQADIYDSDRENLKELIGFKSANTSRMVNTIKDKLSDKLGCKVMANNSTFQKVKGKVFKKYEVIKWEDIPVEKYNDVFAFIDTYIEDEL